MFKIKQIMSIGLMRKIDSFVGTPLLYFLRWSTHTGNEPLNITRPPQKVIVTKFLGIGSTVLAQPFFESLKANGIKVAFWTFPGPGELAQTLKWADEVWVIKPTPLEFLPTLFKTLWQAFQFKADALIDLEPTANFTSILGRLTLSKKRFGFQAGKPLRESLFTHLILFQDDLHMRENFMNLCKVIVSLNYSNSRPEKLPPKKRENQEPIQVLININTSDLSWQRKWPEAHWVQLCHHLLSDPAIEILFTGSPSETQLVTSLIEKIDLKKRVINLAGKTSLDSLLKIIEDSDLVISIDSGIMHLTTMTNTPLVALFGPESPLKYGAQNCRTQNITKNLPCSPCLKVQNNKVSNCNDNQCMKLITPEEVFKACKVQL